MSESFIESIERTIPSEMERLHVPGCALALIEDFQLAEVRCFGVEDRNAAEQVKPETRFCLQSVSKSLAGWATMKLVEEGRLNLDRPISNYLERWTLPASKEFDLDQVTPRRLLSHHAGVTVAGIRGIALNEKSYALIDAMEGNLPPPTPEMEAHFAFWNLERDDKPVALTFRPGSGWNYSNAGFAILELAIEDITGQSYADFVEQTIFKPLGMNHSCFDRVEDLPFAAPHDRNGRPTSDHRWMSKAAGGAYSSIVDLAKFAIAGMDSSAGPPRQEVLSATSVATMHTPHGNAYPIGDVQCEAGLGHVLFELNGHLNVHHTGGSLGWRSVYSIFPRTGSGICMLMNGETANDLWQPIVWKWRELQSENA